MTRWLNWVVDEVSMAAKERVGTDDEGEEGAGTDNEEGWEDENAELTVEERHELERTIRPVKIVLAKVHTTGMLNKTYRPVWNIIT